MSKSLYKLLPALVVLLAVSAAFAAGPQSVVIGGVPDWNQPATYGDFVPPLDPPPAVGGVASWCTPTAASNVMGYLEDTCGFNGLGDGVASPGSIVYPNNDTDAGLPDGQPDYLQNKWRDGTMELGFFMDTQDWAVPQGNPAHTGTLFGNNVVDCPGGIQIYLNNYGNPQWTKTAWNYDTFNGGAAVNSFADYCTGGLAPTIPPVVAPVPSNGIDFDDPVLVTFDYWINPALATTYVDDTNQITWYDWTGASGGESHTVCGMGYAVQWDPDGDDPNFATDTWIICHDGWAGTGYAGTGHVAVPWRNDLWWANTHVEVVPEPATMTLLAAGALVLLRRKRN